MQQTNFIAPHQPAGKSGSWTLILLCVLFVAPFILGSLFYVFRDAIHFNPSAKGEVLAPRLAKEVLNCPIDNFLGKWQLVYFFSAHCDANCQQHTEVLQNLCTALGKDKPRVVLRTVPFSTQEPKLHSSSFSSLPIVAGSVVIVDPQGWLVTHYNPTDFHPKWILEDLRRLMRYSHVG